MQMKGKMRRFLGLILTLVMVVNINIAGAGTEVKAASGYDVILTSVGIYQENGVTKAYADYYNAGNVNVDKNFQMSFYIDKNNAGSVTAQSNQLKPGETKRAVVTLSQNYSGNHSVTAVADIEDGKVSNNNRTSYCKVNSSAPEVTTKEPETTTKTPETTTKTPETTTKEPETTTKTPETTTKTPETTTVNPQKVEAKVVALGGYSENVSEGDDITITALVQNTGGVDIPAGTEFVVNIKIDGNIVQTVKLTQAIPANGYVKIDTRWTATIGGHTFVAEMDGSSVTKRLNVAKKINRDYTPTSGVDLYVTDIGWYNVTTGETNGSIKSGDLIQFIAYGVNAGNQASPSGDSYKHGVQFQFDGSTYGNGGIAWNDKFYGPLAAGATYDFQATGGNRDGDGSCWKATDGSHSILAWIDDSDNGGLIAESNENNNRTTVTIQVPYTVNFGTTDKPDNVNVNADPVALGEVEGLTTTKVSKRAISLTWVAAQGATSYNIYRDGTYIGSTVALSYTDNGTFNVGQNYTYTVKAVQDNTESQGRDIAARPEESGAEVQAYPVPSGFDASNGITMTVNDESVGVFRSRVSETHWYPGNGWKSDVYSNFAIFDYEGGDAEVKITVNRTDINYVDVKPKSDNITATTTRSGNSTIITMILPDGKQGQYDLEINGSSSHDNTIFVFAQEIMTEPANTWKTVRAGDAPLTGHIEVPDNQTLYIEGGATIEGYVHLGNNSKLLGRGIISQKTWGAWGGSNRNNPLSIGYEPLQSGRTGGPEYGRNNVTVEGITILDSCGWAFNIRNSHDVTIKDVNIITASANGDGITVQSAYNIDVEGCFIRTMDDSLVIKNYDNINSHHIKFSNCIIWTDLAQSMEIGYETNMGGYGGREEAGLPNYDPKIYNVLFNDIDVIHNYHKDVMSIHNANYAQVYHIGYKDIRIEQRSGGLFANGDDYGEFGVYQFGTTRNGEASAHDVQFDNVEGMSNTNSINADTFIHENSSY